MGFTSNNYIIGDIESINTHQIGGLSKRESERSPGYRSLLLTRLHIAVVKPYKSTVDYETLIKFKPAGQCHSWANID